MFWIILWFTVYCLSVALVCYCNDRPKFPHGVVSNLHMPSIYDLGSNATLSITDDYVRNVICPSHCYFELKAELDDPGDPPMYTNSITLTSGFAVFMNMMFYVTPSEFCQEHNILTIVLCSVCVLLVCVVSLLLIRYVYKSKYSIRGYVYGPEDLRGLSEHHPDPYSIDADRNFQNLVISCYYTYLFKIRKTVRIRKILQRHIITLYLTVIFPVIALNKLYFS